MGTQSHQAIYNQYTDPTQLVMTFTSVTSTPVPAPPATPTSYTVTLNFTLMNNVSTNHLPYVDDAKLPSLLQKTFYAVQYNSATRQYLNSIALAASPSSPCNAPPKQCSTGVVQTNPGANDGKYSITVTGFPYDPTTAAAPFDGAMVYGYVAKDLLNVESYAAAGSHYQLYANLSSAALPFGTAAVGDANAYVSYADVTACQGCHGDPYRKHGYREALVGNGVKTAKVTSPTVPTFAPCKACHYDNRVGSDKDFQQMVDDPLGWATGADPNLNPQYTYNATVMNDVHMSHAAEFAYPMSMANCVTCHTGSDTPGGKLYSVRQDKYFTGETCTSCHPLKDNSPAYPTEKGRAPALQALWTASNTTFHNGFANGLATDCVTSCHATGSGVARPFSQLHSGYNAATGYNAAIYDTSVDGSGNKLPTYGLKYSAMYGAKIDSATLTGTCTAAATSGCVLDVVFEPTFTAPGTQAIAATIVPEVSVSFYGWDTKDFLISRHTADARAPTANCPGFTGAPGGCTMEYTIGTKKNPLFTEVARNDGKWEVQLDVAAWIPPANTTGTVPAEILAGRIKKAEIAVQPALSVNSAAVALNAVTQTVDVSAPGSGGALASVPNYFQGTNAIVDVAKCNNCHDALGPTFHGGSYGGSVVLCRTCHVPTSGAVTIEMQSRSIDSYVHAIHSFQGFGENAVGTVKFTDPVAAKRYFEYTNHTFPNFTVKNCEACHFAGTYDVPDQTTTIPGLLSKSVAVSQWFALDANSDPIMPGPTSRNINNVPSYVVDPSSRACGGCHRADLIKTDDASGLASFNQHTAAGGYLVDTSQTSTVWTSATAYLYGVMQNIMSYFGF
ncbi:MAG TPA: hypothetical protein VMT92_03940 [Steroidobacteraceae bacterium]|nr:hypothetical protein [Steroidobacteraceae bacterium]